MKNSKETKKPSENNLKKLKSFLDEEFKPKPKDIKPPMMTYDEMQNFHKQKILPVYKKLKQQLSQYNFDSVDYSIHTRVAILKIADTLSLFHLKVDINNASRQITIYYSLKYRHKKKKKLFEIRDLENKTIPFNDINTINDDLILSLFTKWYTGKNETIQKDKERNVE